MTMSAADEDTELRDLLIQTLDKNGVLGKIKAELRASIFLALESQEDKTENPIKNVRLQKFLSEKDGKLCVGIIKQFLEYFSLEYTLAVFSPEVNHNESFPEDKEVANVLNLKSDSPFLQQIISRPKNSKADGLDESQISFLKSKFTSFDHASTGTIDKNDVATVLSLACPQMNKELIHVFVHDELEMANPRVSFNSFINMCHKLYHMCVSVVNVGVPNKTQSSLQQKHENILSHFMTSEPASTGGGLSKIESPKNKGNLNDVGVPSAYLLPINSPDKEMRKANSRPDSFFDSDIGGNLRTRSVDPSYTHIDTPAISPTSSQHESDVPKKGPNDESSEQQQYEDDFHTEQSITEDIQDVADDLLQSDKDESWDLTDDRTVSDTPRADYMEDIRHG